MQDGNQDDGANEGNGNATPETKGCTWKQEVRQEATDERAHYADNDIAYDPVSPAAHYDAGKETGDQTYY